MSRRIILVDIGSGLSLSGVLPSVLLFASYAATLKTRGGRPPYVYTLASGALPDGLMLDRATGIINGTTSEAGSFSFVVRVTDLSGAFVDRPFVIAVTAEPLTLSGNAPDGTLGVAYTYSYTAAGGMPPRTYSIVSGALPDGVMLNAATGALSGTTSAGGSFAWTVRVTDNAGVSFDLADSASVGYATLALSGVFADATVGVAYSSELTITGGDGSYSNPRATVGSLPSWGTLGVVGDKLRLSGTPSGAATTVSVTVAVDSGDGQTATSAQSFAVTSVSDPLFAYVKSLMHFEGSDGSATFTDVIPGNVWTVRGGDPAVLTTTSPLFGSSSFLTKSVGPAPSGSGHIPPGIYCNDPPVNPGTGDFSFEFTMRCDATPVGLGSIAALESSSTGGTGFYIRYGSTGKIEVRNNAFYIFTGITPPPLGQVTRVELTRVAGVLYFFFNGVLQASTAYAYSMGPNNTIYLGAENSGPSFDGLLDEFRLTIGVGRHTSNYTPDAGAFPDS